MSEDRAARLAQAIADHLEIPLAEAAEKLRRALEAPIVEPLRTFGPDAETPPPAHG